MHLLPIKPIGYEPTLVIESFGYKKREKKLLKDFILGSMTI